MDFTDAVLQYNRAYASADWPHRLASMADGFRLLARPATSCIAAAGWIVSLIILVRPGGKATDSLRPAACLAAFAVPAEVVLATLAGRDYPHYFASWLPAAALCTAVLVAAPSANRSAKKWLVNSTQILVLVVLAVGSVGGGRKLRDQLLTPSADTRVEQTSNYLAKRTTRDERVLVWGAEATINFLTRRAAPTRFVYQYPLYTAGYTRDELVEEFLRDLQRTPPRFVVDTSATNPIILSLVDCSTPRIGRPDLAYSVPAGMEQVCRWIGNNYTPVDRIAEWTVLARRTPTAESGGCDGPQGPQFLR